MALSLHSLEAHCEPLLNNDELRCSLEFEYKTLAPIFELIARHSSFCSLSDVLESISPVFFSTHNWTMNVLRSEGPFSLGPAGICD